MSQKITDILIVGLGLAGMIAAITAAKNGKKVTIITKTKNIISGNTPRAQGGIVYKGLNDSPRKLKQDILKEVKIIQNSLKNKKILGVCFRGADQKTIAYHPHTPTEEQMIFATNLLIKKHKFDKIYLCTEEIDNLNF